MSCMRMRENGEFVQVAVKGALTQFVQKVVEKLLVTALYSLQCFLLMKEVDHFDYPQDIWHTLVVLILKTIIQFILPKITDSICIFPLYWLITNITNKSFL